MRMRGPRRALSAVHAHLRAARVTVNDPDRSTVSRMAHRRQSLCPPQPGREQHAALGDQPDLGAQEQVR
jgi:hypothetical protein